MITDIISNKKIHLIVTELFIRSQKPNISLVFMVQSFFQVPKDEKKSTANFFIMKNSKKARVSTKCY